MSMPEGVTRFASRRGETRVAGPPGNHPVFAGGAGAQSGIGKGRPWPKSPETSASRSAPTSAGRSATRRSSSSSTSPSTWQGDTVGFARRARHHRAVRSAPAVPLRHGHRPAHALVPHQPRVDQEGHPDGRAVRLQQPLGRAVDGEAHDLLRDDAPGHAHPRDLDGAAQVLRGAARPQAHAAPATRASSTSPRSAARSATRCS